MNVCDNLGDHLVGNVYVKVLSLLLYVLCLCGLISNILENGGDVKCYVKLLFFRKNFRKRVIHNCPHLPKTMHTQQLIAPN